MLAFFYTCIFVVGAWVPFVYHHHLVHGVVNPLHVALTLFNAINLLICLWENALFLHRGKVRRVYNQLKKKHGDRTLPSPMCLFENITLGQAFSYEYWSIIWSTYSLLDPSYANQTSFGFWIDSGNGVVTLPPTLLLSYAATWNIPWLSARAIGIVGIIFNYQMLYGTVLYFCNYCLNGYYVKTAPANVGVVAAANGIWIGFPLAWMWACWRMIETDSFAVLR